MDVLLMTHIYVSNDIILFPTFFMSIRLNTTPVSPTAFQNMVVVCTNLLTIFFIFFSCHQVNSLILCDH